MDKERLLNLLLKMLETTTPHKKEFDMYNFLPEGGYFDDIGNYIVTIGEDSKTLFCCHLDTFSNKKEKVNPEYMDGWIYSKNKVSCLGGDDKCGVLCCIALIENNVPGTYIFHVGEEKGGLGALFIQDNFDLTLFDRCIEFDRKGTDNIITAMNFKKTCSDEFAKEICNRLDLNFKPDNTGIFTDNFYYINFIPEVTNISVGYFNQHSKDEKINARWLIDKLIPSLVNIDWESLPVVRNNLKEEYNNDYYHFGFYKKSYEIDLEDFDNEFDLDLLYNEYDNLYCNICFSNSSNFEEFTIFHKKYIVCNECYNFLLESLSYYENNNIILSSSIDEDYFLDL